MPISSRVSSSAQSSTTTAMFSSRLRKRWGSRRSARATSASNSFRLISTMRRTAGDRLALESADPLDADDVLDGRDRRHDALELVEIPDLHREVVEPLAVLGD